MFSYFAATMYGAVPNQHYPMATVMEDGYFQQNSLDVDENGILWEEQHNRVANAMSPPYERRQNTQHLCKYPILKLAKTVVNISPFR